MKINSEVPWRPKFLTVFFLILFLAGTGTVRAFVHPGIPLTLADLSTLKTNITKSPWSSGYAALVTDGHSSLGYTMLGPATYVNRNNAGNYDNENIWEHDMWAVYNLARMWYFTGNTNYAQKSHDILVAWANTMTNFGGIEASFDIGDHAYQYSGGADILRGTWPGWTAADTAAVSKYFTNVFWPDLAIPGEVAQGSQGTEDLIAAVAISVFCDDTNRFNQTLSAFLTDADSGFRGTYANGEMIDTGRDQGHAGLYLYDLAWSAEVFWKQGVDVFSIMSGRIHACGEYYTRYNMSYTTPYVPIGASYWGLFNNIGGSPGSSGLNNMTPNLIHGAYAVRLGIQTPYIDMYGLNTSDQDGFMLYKVADSSTATPPTITALPTNATVSAGLVNANLNGSTPAGATSYSSGVWTLTGGFNGSDPWYSSISSDTVHFAYKTVTGDFTMIAKVNSVFHVNGHAKAGLMMRNSLTSASYRVYVAITDSTTYERCMLGYSDLPYGSNAESISSTVSQVPYWVRIERVGNRVQTFTSYDGASWAPAGTADFNGMPSTMYVGLFNTSDSTGVSGTATFSDVRLTGGNNGEALQAPPAPFAVYASPGAGQVPLHWNESFAATSYTVLRSTTNGGPYTTVATVTNTVYVDTDLAPSTTYYYVVTASNSAGTSAGYSLPDSVTTASSPPTPVDLTALPGNLQATLLWSDSTGATNYNVLRSLTSGSGYILLTNVSIPSFSDTGLANGTTYYYIVSASGPTGQSDNSAEISVTPSASAPDALIWSGTVNGSWDTTTSNWWNSGGAADFQSGDVAIFNDVAAGSLTVSNVVAVAPASVIFDTAKFYYDYANPIGGAAKLTKLGSGEAFLASANSFTGGAAVLAGKLTIQNATALGSGTLTLNGGTFDAYGLLTLANNIVITNSGSAIQLDSANNLTLTGTFSGNGSVTLGNDADNNSLYLSGPNLMTGGTIAISGNNNYVRFTSAIAGNANADWVFNNQPAHVTFDFASGTIHFGSLAGGGSIQGNVNGVNSLNVTISVGANNRSTTFSGLIHNNGWGTGLIGLTKVGAGTLTLTGANDYTGATAVNAGALIVSTLSLAEGNYTVANGATLGVTNSASGSALASNVTVAAGATLDFQGVASTAQPLLVASNLTLSGVCTVKVTGTGGLVAGNTYPLISSAGVLSGDWTNVQLQMPYGWRGTLMNSGNQIVLANVTTVTTTPPQVAMVLSSQQLQFTWPADHIGWRLECQTNSAGSGLGTNWFTWDGSLTTNQIMVPIDPASGGIFFRLVYP